MIKQPYIVTLVITLILVGLTAYLYLVKKIHEKNKRMLVLLGLLILGVKVMADTTQELRQEQIKRNNKEKIESYTGAPWGLTEEEEREILEYKR